jgi:serine/threonine protein kinase
VPEASASEVVGGYRLLKHMATGQNSQVWEVVEVASHRHFAMKLLLPEHVGNPTYRNFLLHEAEVGLKMAHANIIRIVHVDRNPANPHFVMEYFPSGSLRLRLLRKETDFIRQKGQDILKQWATGLAFMNAQGWIHRDVKPDNLLINAAGEAKLIDFAIAVRASKETFFGKLFRRKGKTQGTRSYMSPEQIRGLPLDGRADIYSFACSAYEMITNRPPYRGASAQELLQKHFIEKPVTPAQYNPEVTDQFAKLILRMLAKKREERPRDFHEVLMAMRAIRLFKG